MSRSVFINEVKLLREAFSKSVFCGRLKMDHFTYFEHGLHRGIGFTNGSLWKEQRRFCFSYLQSKMRNVIESHILSSVKDLISSLKKTNGMPLETVDVINPFIVNVLWTTIAGKRNAAFDPKFKKALIHSENIGQSVTVQGILVFFSAFSKLLPKLSGFNSVRNDLKAIRKLMQETVNEHKITYNAENERDFIDFYLNKIYSTTDTNSSFYGQLGEENLVASLVDLFLAATDTTISALSFVLFFVAYHPDVQEKLAQEVQQQIKSGNWPSLQDKSRMPYVRAVIEETLRFSSLIPLGLFHEVLEDVEFHGHILPKGTAIVSNVYGIMHDKETWGDPEKFRPERFLTNDEKDFIQNDDDVVFSIGRRICPGKSFALDELFMFTSCLFQHFQVEFDPSSPKPVLDYKMGILLRPVEYKIVFHTRSA